MCCERHPVFHKKGFRMPHKQEQGPAKHKWLALVGLVVAMSAIVMDGTIMNVALPSVMRQMSLTATEGEWIVTIYSLVFCALLVTFGRIADSIGRKKTLILGLIVFSAGAVVGALANNYPALMVGRGIQGVGGALVLPTIMSTMNAIYTDKMRILAFALFGSLMSAMSAIGPWLGGMLVTYSTWRWVFWIDIPLSLVSAFFDVFAVPETYGEKMRGFDVLGFILSCIGFGCLIYGLIEGKTDGWWKPESGVSSWAGLSPVPWLLAVAVVAIVVFVLWDLHAVNKGRPYLMDFHLFKVGTFSLSISMQIIFRMGMVGLLFLVPQFLQNVLGMSAVNAGAITCIMGIASLIAGFLATPIVRATSTKFAVAAGMLIMMSGAIGLSFLLRETIDPNPWAIRGWLALFGFGMGIASAQLSAILMSGVPNKLGGQASSIQSTAFQTSAALGIGIIGSVFGALLWGELPAAMNNIQMPQQMRSSIENSIVVTQGDSIPIIEEDKEFQRMPEEWQKSFDTNVKSGFSKGLADTAFVTAGALGVTFLMSFALPGKKKLREEMARTRELDKEEGDPVLDDEPIAVDDAAAVKAAVDKA